MYAVIGDVIGSRRLADRGGAQTRVVEALADVSRTLPGVQPLEATVGDEFQGAYASLGEATRCTLLVRLALLPGIDVRCGIGVGDATVFDAQRTPWLQDGPAWWAARRAVDTAKRLGGRPASRHVRSWACAMDPEGNPADDTGTVPLATVNAYFSLQDFVLAGMQPRQVRLLAAVLRGEPQREIADREGVTKSAVSQQFSRGISAVRDAQALLEQDPVGRG